MKDCYEILGTSIKSVYSIEVCKNEAERNSYIEQCYKGRKKILEAEKDYLIRKQEPLEEINRRIKECKEVYEQIKTEELREKYNKTIEEKAKAQEWIATIGNTGSGFRKLKSRHEKVKEKIEQTKEEKVVQRNKYNEFREKYQQEKNERTAYGNLNFVPETLERLTEQEADKKTKNAEETLINLAQKEFEEESSITEKAEIALKINTIKKSYEEVATKAKREEYKEHLAKEKKQKFKEKYDHTKEYNLNLIRTSQGKEDSLSNKKIVKMPEPSRVINFTDKEGRNVRIRKTAVIGFLDNTSKEIHKVYEYEVKRQIREEVKTDTVYTDVSVVTLDFEQDLVNFNKEYYNCVVNKLFTEEMIEASKYNEGYIGGIEKDKEGKYHTTLGNDRLSIKEQKMLTAIMIQKQKEKEEERGER